MYIDAGTGSMLLQAGAAIFFTAVIFFKQLLGVFHLSRKTAEREDCES